MEDLIQKYNEQTLEKPQLSISKKHGGGGHTEWKNLNSYLQSEVVLSVLRKEIEFFKFLSSVLPLQKA